MKQITGEDVEQIMREGRAAQRLLDDEDVQALLRAMEVAAVSEWKTAADPMRREQLWTEVAVIASFGDNLRIRVDRMKVVEAQQLRAAGGKNGKAAEAKRAERW